MRRKKQREPVSLKGAGSRASRPKKPTLYDKWRDIVEPATFAKMTRNTATRQAFAKNMKTLREELPEGIKPADVMPRAWEIFANDIRSGKVLVKGKDTWFVFFGRRAKYVDMAIAQRTSDEIPKSGNWI